MVILSGEEESREMTEPSLLFTSYMALQAWGDTWSVGLPGVEGGDGERRATASLLENQGNYKLNTLQYGLL